VQSMGIVDGGTEAGAADAGAADAGAADAGPVGPFDSGSEGGPAACPGVPSPPTGITGDPNFALGAPASVAYTAPGTTSNIAFVSEGSAKLWELVPDLWRVGGPSRS
jgi:hypothetical protein